MDGLKDLVVRFWARLERVCKNSKDKGALAVSSDDPAVKVAQVQQAIQNGEEAQHLSDLKTVKRTLRNTLHDMPSAVSPPSYGKERHWFDSAPYEHKPARSTSSTWTRLESFLSTTDPKQLSSLDPTWNQQLAEAQDDRPQPKKASVDLPKIRKPIIEETSAQQIFQEGVISDSTSGVF